MIDPNATIDQNHFAADRRRTGISRSGSLPPSRARRRALSRSMRALSASRTSWDFSLRPVNACAFASCSSSSTIVVRTSTPFRLEAHIYHHMMPVSMHGGHESRAPRYITLDSSSIERSRSSPSISGKMASCRLTPQAAGPHLISRFAPTPILPIPAIHRIATLSSSRQARNEGAQPGATARITLEPLHDVTRMTVAAQRLRRGWLREIAAQENADFQVA